MIDIAKWQFVVQFSHIVVMFVDEYRYVDISESIADIDIDQLIVKSMHRPVHFFVYSAINADKDAIRSRLMNRMAKRSIDTVVVYQLGR